jgi:drug/metabolite transporter (DMT)-like permease
VSGVALAPSSSLVYRVSDFLGERLDRFQQVGIAAVVGGVIAISIG